MKRDTVIFIILPPVIFALGYFLGALLHPKFASHKAAMDVPIVANLFGNDIVDLTSGEYFTMDTLSAHEKNLLIFWSPTCSFCKKLFQNNLNAHVVGIFCFPTTDDLEYTEYFINHHNIAYPQLVSMDSSGVHSVDAQFISAIPMFYVVDSHGKILMSHQGINDLNHFIETLYKR